MSQMPPTPPPVPEGASSAPAASTAPAAAEALDEVYANERKTNVQWMPGFLPKPAQTNENAFANHTPMAAEAMATLGVDSGTIAAWAATWDKNTASDYENAIPVQDWKASLGDFDAVGAFTAAVDSDIAELGWRAALKLWCSRLLPGLGAQMFHGMLRVAHAVRALGVVENDVRRQELSVAVAAWATHWGSTKCCLGIGLPGATSSSDQDVEDAILAHATRAAHVYVDEGGTVMSGIDKLHGVTGPMAYLDMLMPELDRAHHDQALDAFNRTHKELLGDVSPSTTTTSIDFPDLTELRLKPLEFAGNGEQLQHIVKLCDASSRAYSRSKDPVFAQCALKALKKPAESAL